MIKLKIFSATGTSSQEKDISGLPSLEENKGNQALRDVIISYQANARQGNASTKTRSEVSGGNRKPWRQKGTGMARHGSRRSPIWVGGGVAFGPKPRDYSKKIVQKVKALAFKRALINRLEDGDVALIEELTCPSLKTKSFHQLISNIYSSGKILFIDQGLERNAILSSRNIQRMCVCEAASLNAWDLVRFDKILFSEKGFEHILQRINK